MNELQTDYLANKTVYFLVRNAIGQIWDGGAFVAYVTANFATYVIAATEQGTASGFYTGNMPVVAAGVYSSVAKQQIGGSPAESDISIGWGDIQWSGTAVIPLSGPVGANLTQILGQPIPQVNAGQIANNFGFFFDVSPTTTNTVDTIFTGPTVAQILEADVSGAIENAAAVHSLATVVLKHTSRVEQDNLQTTYTTYKTDALNAKMTQSITTNTNLKPVQSLGEGS